MAKRRKAKRSSRRRRIGAVRTGLMEVLQLTLGGVASQFAGKLVDMIPVVKDQSEMIKGAVKGALPIGLGMALPKLIKGSGAVGKGMIVGGGISLVRAVAPKFVGAIDYYANKPVPKISGYNTGTAGNYISGYNTGTAGNYIAGMSLVGAVCEEAGA